MRIDDVARLGRTQQHARSAAELVIDGHDLDSPKQTREARLSTGAAAPDLRDDGAVAHGRTSSFQLALEQRYGLSITH